MYMLMHTVYFTQGCDADANTPELSLCSGLILIRLECLLKCNFFLLQRSCVGKSVVTSQRQAWCVELCGQLIGLNLMKWCYQCLLSLVKSGNEARQEEHGGDECSCGYWVSCWNQTPQLHVSILYRQCQIVNVVKVKCCNSVANKCYRNVGWELSVRIIRNLTKAVHVHVISLFNFLLKSSAFF